MARSNQVQVCIFCGEVPCACSPKADKPKVARKAPKIQGQSSTVGVTDEVIDFTEKASRFKVEEKVKPELDEDELILREAIRNLEPILSPRDKRKFDGILNPPLPDGMERKIAEWRQRNGKLLQSDGEA